MKTATKLTAFVFMLFFTLSSLKAATLAVDRFDYSTDGWSGYYLYNDNGWLYMDRTTRYDYTYATKSFDLGSAYASTEVYVEFDLNLIGGWESSGTYQDVFRIYINGTLVDERFYGDGNNYDIYDHVGFLTTTDSNGRIEVRLEAVTTTYSEDARIDNFTIRTADPTVYVEDVYIEEGDSGVTYANVTLTISPAPSDTVVVEYSTSDDTATLEDNDYQSTSGTLTFDAETTSLSVQIPIVGDTKIESEERLFFDIAIVSGDAALDRNRIYVYIVNDDEVDIEVTEKDFEIVNPQETRVLIGNMALLGNTVLCPQDINGECYEATTTNNNINLEYIDVDGDSETYNSSSSILNIPQGAKIVWAGLFWQGYLHYNYEYDDPFVITRYNLLEDVKNVLNNPVKFKKPSVNDYINIYADHIYLQEVNDYGYSYSAFKEITSLMDQDPASANGVYTLANIPVQNGRTEDNDDGLGNFGAWTIVVIYENKDDPNEKFRNIAVFEGYKVISGFVEDKDRVDIDIEGFYTPTSGPVDSELFVFAGEGDKYISGDYMQLNGTTLPDSNPDDGINNFFDSSVTDIVRTPSVDNNNGIDIHKLKVGKDGDDTHPQIIGNEETSAVITLRTATDGTSRDTYFPSMVAFSTEIYQPKICYLETLYDSNGEVLDSQVSVGSTITAKLTIRNDDNETAQDVKIFKYFDQNQTSYNPESTLVQNVGSTQKIPQTDAAGDDLVDYSENDSLLTVRLGTGADSTTGGTFLPADVAYLDYNFTVRTTDSFSLSYKTSYIFNIAGQEFTFDGNLPKCEDFDNAISAYIPAKGVFNVVNENFNSATDPVDANSALNSLYTQIAGKYFGVKVVKVSNDLETLENFNGIVKISIIDTPNFPENATDETKNQMCYDAPAQWEKFVTFNRESLKYVNDAIANMASQSATFKITYLADNNGYAIETNQSCFDATYNCVWGMLTQAYTIKYGNDCPTGQLDNGESCTCADVCYYANYGGGHGGEDNANEECLECVFGSDLAKALCARDNFAIRPDTYSFDFNETKLIGAKTYKLDIAALKYYSSDNTLKYDQTIDQSTDKNITNALILPLTCTTLSGAPIAANVSTFSFSDGNATVYYKYNNVGDLNITLNDNQWTQIDQNVKDDGTKDCIENSDTNIPVGGKIGCLIRGSSNVKFIPQEYKNSVTLQNANGGSFTYLSQDANMSARINLSVSALLADGNIATNYTAGCFAEDINYTLSLINNRTLTWSDSQTRIRFFETSTADAVSADLTQPTVTFRSSEGNFTSGVSNLSVRFNFDRNVSRADEPFQIFRNDFNITLVTNPDGNVTGNDFNRTSDHPVNFYYGRIHSPDYTDSDSDNTIAATLFYEVYIKNGTDFAGIRGSESVDDVYWYVNTAHTIQDGNITSLQSFSGTSSLNFNPGSSLNVTGGAETQNITYSGTSFPFKDKIIISTQPWMIFNKFDPTATTEEFEVYFPGQPKDWAGIGSTGETVDLNMSGSTQQRIEW